jgi:hydrogenase/urease accessory protein HupE
VGLISLAALAGLAHGPVLAPALVIRGLPEEGLALCIGAFVVGMALAQAALGLVAFRVLRIWRERFEHNARYGGMNWPRATQIVSLSFVALGALWVLEYIWK